MQKLQTQHLTRAAAVGAAYAVLSLFSSVFSLTFGVVQCRFSEALCVLPFFFPETVWGLFAGCLITNILSPYGLLDLIVGSLATLIAALLTARCRKKWLAPLPPVVLNTLLVGAVIAYEETGLTVARFLDILPPSYSAVGFSDTSTYRRRRGHRLLWAGDAPAVAAAQDPLFPGSRLPLNRRLCGPSSACLHSAQSGGSIKSIRRESYRSAAGVPQRSGRIWGSLRGNGAALSFTLCQLHLTFPAEAGMMVSARRFYQSHEPIHP